MPRTSSVSRIPRTSKSSRTAGDTKPADVDVDTEENEEGGIDLELGVSVAGMGASISTSGVLKVGIGIAAVEFDLKEPNNSKLSYVWDLYQIEGKRDGCTVVLTYSIKGIEVKKETRTIPECEKPEPEPEPEPEPDPENPGADKLPSGHPMDIIFRVLPGKGYDDGWSQSKKLIVEEVNSNNRPKIFKSKTTNDRAFPNYYRPTSNPVWDQFAVPPITSSDPRWNYLFEDVWTFRSPTQKGRIADYVTLYQWFTASNFRTSGWNDFKYVGFEGPRWWVDNETVNYWVGIWFQRRLPTKSWITVHDEYSYYPGQFHIYCEHIIKKHSSPLPRGIPPIRGKDKMNDCCKMIAGLYEALAVNEMLENGVETPNRWIVAGGKKHTVSKNYLDLMVFHMRMLDHLGIHPFTAEVTDVNAAQEGNQSASVEFVNATAALKQITELLLENKGDSATRLNLMIRTAIAVGQVLNIVSIISKTIEGIVGYLGMPIKERIFKVQMPFDFTFGARNGKKSGQGFGKKPGNPNDALNVNTEEATEALLPKFMQDSEQPIRVEDFDDRQGDLIDIIRGK